MLNDEWGWSLARFIGLSAVGVLRPGVYAGLGGGWLGRWMAGMAGRREGPHECGHYEQPRRGDPRRAQGVSPGLRAALEPDQPRRGGPIGSGNVWDRVVGSPRWGFFGVSCTNAPGLRPGLFWSRPVGAFSRRPGLPVVSAGAEYLVMGYLMRRNILTYKAPPGNEEY